MSVFQMPSLGADMEDGTLVEWLVKPGDTVRRGDIVAVVETQKGAIEIEIFEEGVVASLDAEVGRKLPVGAPLATIVAEGEAVAAAPEPAPSRQPATEAVPEPGPQPAPAKPPAQPRPATLGIAASPAARKRAAERGVALDGLRGSGPGGAVMLIDVESRGVAGTSPPAKAPASSARKPAAALSEMRKAIAAAMARSKREIPHFQIAQTLDLQPAADWLAARNAALPPTERILMGTLFMKAAAVAAGKVPEMNGHYSEGGFTPSAEVNLGVAVALRGGGLIAPAIPNADKLGLPELMEAMRDLVARARAMRLRSSEMTSGTLTVSALGEKGAEAMAGVIFPPQVALLAIGAPQTRPWVVGEAVVPRRVVTLTLAADHRVSDGRQANRFLAEMDALLQTPEAL